jgi:hypothetical protein
MSNIRSIEHSVNIIIEFDTDKMPANLAYMMMQYDEEQLNKVLAQTFIATLEHIGAFDKMNKNNVYATIKAGNN